MQINVCIVCVCRKKAVPLLRLTETIHTLLYPAITKIKGSMEKRRMVQIFLLFAMAALCVFATSAHAKPLSDITDELLVGETHVISYDEYCLLSDKYPQAILYNQSPQLAKYHGELGEDDSCLTAFVMDKDAKYFEILVQQDALEQTDSAYITCFYEKISDSTHLFVYSKAYTGSFIVYAKPDKSETLMTLGYVVAPLFITDVEGEWVHISFTHEDAEYEGWVPKSACCANPYTTCN